MTDIEEEIRKIIYEEITKSTVSLEVDAFGLLVAILTFGDGSISVSTPIPLEEIYEVGLSKYYDKKLGDDN